MGVRIRKRRLELGISQRILADMVGVAHVTISQWERGQTSPKGNNLLKLAEALGENPAQLQRGVSGGNAEELLGLTGLQKQLLDLFSRLPVSKQRACIDGLRESVEDYEMIFKEMVIACDIDDLILIHEKNN